ncbi:MAG: N-6 DNA methylase [Parcubacteria group bacterium]|nr:N-6 DNA methylase [Parcubacteria group bacterium]
MINPIFANKYNEEDFTEFTQSIIPSLSLDKKRSEIRTGFKSIQQLAETNENNLDLVVFVANCASSLHARVEIIKNTYAVLKSHARSNALVAYISDDSSEWRLSLITTKVTRTRDGIKESISNPRRFSYVLGPNAKVATPSKMLQGTIDSIIDLENKFSLAVVSKEFFTQIATQYSKLVGGTRGEGRKAMVFERTLKLGNTHDAVNANFAIRLIGRLVFCWFLKQKKGHLNNPLIPSEILSTAAVKKIGDYYHSVCVPLFFEVMNKQESLRPTFFSHAELFDKVPFLNGGLFQDHEEDNHKFNRTTGLSERRGVVKVPDIWFFELFQIFEEYNFTIDENTSIDTELSIDPEMLGRIFENLLAEVNPETGASARKSTGSFYTPREIVDFMVEESLIAHLRTKTNISEEKLRALSSYDLDDDASHPIDKQERKLLVEEIHKTTVLDPACGSGAFPIGVLQRLVHMLGVLDPDCLIYFSNIPPEIRRQLQKHSLTYVRKLGVIRECIHGVDIQPIAIDISRLRCFLTLVVDQQVDDDAPNRGIEPLPNLDFKFVCANTLIKPPDHEGQLFGDEFADALGELIDEYFAPVDQNHKLITVGKLQRLISDKTYKELESIERSYAHLKDEKHKQVLAQRNEKSITERIRINSLWKSYENIFQNKPVGFFDTRYFFPLVFRNGGFDIVIGNPPYITLSLGKKQTLFTDDYLKLLESLFVEVKEYKNNTFSYFIKKAYDLTNNNGVISYIVPNVLLFNKSFSKVRKFMLDNSNISYILDIKDKVFESAEIGGNCVFVSNKNKILTESKVLTIQDIEDIIAPQYESIDQKRFNLPPDFKFYIDSLTYEIFIKIEKVGKKLSELCSFYNGIKTGDNKRFLKDIKDNELDELVLRGREIQKYYINEPSVYVCFDKEKLWSNTNEELLRKSPKILVRQTGDSITCAVDDKGRLHMDTTHGLFDIKVNIYYLVGLLNSKVISYWHRAYTSEKGRTFAEVKIANIKNIPIKLPEDERIVNLTKSILTLKKQNKDADTQNLESQIDQLVYKLYDLTPEEVEIVENSSKK